MQAGLLSLYWEACLWEACLFCVFQLSLNQPPDGNLVHKYGCGPTALGTMNSPHTPSVPPPLFATAALCSLPPRLP